jgi:cobalt-precorrin-5B (C1)-methyltransferase
VAIEGGAGVGRVTLPGLDQPPGAPAINSGPRAMIARELAAVAEQAGYPGGFFVEISIPGGAELAARTFNPRLGIQGGLSILGTTGILEPMSTQAQADTLRAQLAQLAAAGAREALLTPGRYGEAFARDRLGLCMDSHIPCGNHIGDALDAGAELGFTHLLLVGHIGKLVKLGIGITNTHSAQGDGRMETLLACALEAGAALPLLRGVAGSVTADGALALLWQGGLLEKTMALLGRRIQGCLERRLPAGTTGGFLCFTNAPAFAGVLTQSGNAENLLERWRQRP